MNFSIPPISQFMTPVPILIDAGAGLREADLLMSSNRFRHLPMVKDGKLIGILSDRDLKIACALNVADLDFLTVEEVARAEVYSVSPDDAVDLVVEAMAERRIGGAVVMQNEKIVGIFTTTDALYAFCRLLRQE
jgi:acetoin utilization protein AcuB